MTASRAARSRASSVARTARGHSVARNITKRRDKPFKTELQTVKTKKKKLNLDNTFYEAPPGYLYLAVGTPELSERCKELSRLRGCQVTIVHSQPTNLASARSDKVSGHIHRIGYHFRQDVLQDAARELGYVFDTYERVYIKQAELQARIEQSAMARTLAKHGIAYNDTKGGESREQIQAAVRELFPKIPQADLEFIYDHAWEQGTDRIGTRTEMPLSARVQLAVGSRIRHHYTDYDKLLKVFGDWQAVRAIVEPFCVDKLIQWRGELVDGEEFEELVRETIIIDDDDEDNGRAVVETDDDSADSDTSIEIVHKAAAAEDVGAESHDERSRDFIERYLPRPRQQQHVDVRQKIDLARSRRLQSPQKQYSVPETRVEVVNLPPGQDSVKIGDNWYRLARPSPDIRPSIEQADDGRDSLGELVPRRTPQQSYPEPRHVRPMTAEGETPGKRRKMGPESVGISTASVWNVHGQPPAPSQPDRPFGPSQPIETANPARQSMISQQQSLAHANHLPPQGRYPVQSVHQSIESGSASRMAVPHRYEQHVSSGAVIRDIHSDRFSGQPRARGHEVIIVDEHSPHRGTLPPPVHGAPAPVQQVPRPGGYLPQAGTGSPQWFTQVPQPPPPPPHYQVHGAPAPVQQLPRPGGYSLPHGYTEVAPPPPPQPQHFHIHGAPAPIQQVPRPVVYPPGTGAPGPGQPQYYSVPPPPSTQQYQYQYQYQYPR